MSGHRTNSDGPLEQVAKVTSVGVGVATLVYGMWKLFQSGESSNQEDSVVLESRRRQDSNPKAFLHDLKNELSLLDSDTRERVELVEHLKEVLKKNLMAISPLFKVLFREIHHTGSYYDGLRIRQADEFDLNVVLSLDEIASELKNIDAGFAFVVLKDKDLRSMKPAWVATWNDFMKQLTTVEQGCVIISPRKTFSWFQSLIDKLLFSKVLDGPYKVTRATHGPAVNLVISHPQLRSQIDIDLVPVLEFKSLKMLPRNAQSYWILEAKGFLHESFFLVPKPTETTSNRWRIDFHKVEHKIVGGYQKTLIRFLKAFRDGNSSNGRNHMNGISSYALKTVVMLMAEDPKDFRVDFTESNMDALFLGALYSLQRSLQSGHLPYYFDRHCDLFWSMNVQRRREISAWLSRALRKLEESSGQPNCYETWKNIFGINFTRGMAS